MVSQWKSLLMGSYEMNGYQSSTLLYFIGHTLCKNKMHIQTSQYTCRKHNSMIYNCKICQQISNSIKYSYQCCAYACFFCIHHFIDHCLLLKYCAECKIICLSDSIILEGDAIKVLYHMFYKIALNLSNIRIKLWFSKHLVTPQ